MSLTFFTEPFYSLADFDRLFDDAFNAYTGHRRQIYRFEGSGQPQNTALRGLHSK